MEDAQVQDLTLCSSLDEATILRVLKNRFFTNQIYVKFFFSINLFKFKTTKQTKNY